jgi:hypothetical protein
MASEQAETQEKKQKRRELLDSRRGKALIYQES